MAMVCLSDFEAYAKKYLPKIAWDYFAAGADDCNTRDENILAYKRIRFRPRMLRDVSMMDIRTKILGTEISFPVGIAPTGFHQLAWPDGEKSTARAAKAMNTCYIASTYSTCSLEEISAAAPGGLRWFQLYIHRNRAASQQLVQRAEALGFQALVLTTDVPYTGKRRDDIRNGFCLPPHMKLKNLERDFEGDDRSEYGLPPNSLDPSVTWNDVYWLQSLTHLPIIIKGILTKEDAELAVRHGVQGIIVSNHGGRQLDEGPATIDALVEVVEAVQGRVEVYLDGGIRKGSDVLKALALGAKCVFIGRPTLWGLAYKGEEGLQDVLRILQDEFRLSMALAAAVFDPLTDSKLAEPSANSGFTHEQEVVGLRNRIPGEVVSAPNLPEFKKRLDNALRQAVPEYQRLVDTWFSSPSCEQPPAMPTKQRQLKLRSQPD